MTTMSSSPQTRSSDGQQERIIIDPNTIPPDKNPSRFERVFKKLTSNHHDSKIPPSAVPLTKRNLTEFFNPDYNDEHDAFHKVQGPRKISIPEWIQLLP